MPSNKQIMTIGQRIKEERAKAGISQVELARRYGASPAYICNLETGNKVDPSISTLQGIAKSLGIKLSTLARGL